MLRDLLPVGDTNVILLQQAEWWVGVHVAIAAGEGKGAGKEVSMCVSVLTRVSVLGAGDERRKNCPKVFIGRYRFSVQGTGYCRSYACGLEPISVHG